MTTEFQNTFFPLKNHLRFYVEHEVLGSFAYINLKFGERLHEKTLIDVSVLMKDANFQLKFTCSKLTIEILGKPFIIVSIVAFEQKNVNWVCSAYRN